MFVNSTWMCLLNLLIICFGVSTSGVLWCWSRGQIHSLRRGIFNILRTEHIALIPGHHNHRYIPFIRWIPVCLLSCNIDKQLSKTILRMFYWGAVTLLMSIGMYPESVNIDLRQLFMYPQIIQSFCAWSGQKLIWPTIFITLWPARHDEPILISTL